MFAIKNYQANSYFARLSPQGYPIWSGTLEDARQYTNIRTVLDAVQEIRDWCAKDVKLNGVRGAWTIVRVRSEVQLVEEPIS